MDALFWNGPVNSDAIFDSFQDDRVSVILSDCKSLSSFSEPENKHPHRNPKSAKRSRDDETEKHFSLLHQDQSFATGTSGFNLDYNENSPKIAKRTGASNICFQQQILSSLSSSVLDPDSEAIAQMKETVYRAAAFRPVNFGLDMVDDKPKRKNVKISSDPQTAAARQRRERISQRIRVLQRLVPGGTKMDTATLLDEAANYLKFLRAQIKELEKFWNKFESLPQTNLTFSFSLPFLENPTQCSVFTPNNQ